MFLSQNERQNKIFSKRRVETRFNRHIRNWTKPKQAREESLDCSQIILTSDKPNSISTESLNFPKTNVILSNFLKNVESKNRDIFELSKKIN